MKNIIFTKAFTEKIQQEYKRRPEKWKHLFFSATQEEAEFYRGELNNWAANVSPSVLDKMIVSLRKPDKHVHTRNELRVCYHLSQLGLKFEYEKELDGKTPDLFVSSDDLNFIVEIFTANVSDFENAQTKLKGDLINRIKKLAGNAKLLISLNTQLIDYARNEFIVRNLDNWLSSKPAVGISLDCIGVNFQVIQYDERKKISPYFVSSSVIYPEANKLKKKIIKKVRKYHKISKKYSLPLIIAIIPDFHTGLTMEELANVVIGQDSKWSLNKFEKGNLEPADICKDGLFYDKYLSAVIWVTADYYGKSIMQHLRNPLAELPIPANIKL